MKNNVHESFSLYDGTNSQQGTTCTLGLNCVMGVYKNNT